MVSKRIQKTYGESTALFIVLISRGSCPVELLRLKIVQNMKNLAVTVTRLNSLIKRDFVKKKRCLAVNPKS